MEEGTIHTGAWWAPDHPEADVAGRLSRPDGLGRLHLEVLDPFARGWFGTETGVSVAFGGPTTPIPTVYGQVAGLGYVTLLGCRYAGMRIASTETWSLDATHMLVGALLSDFNTPLARRMEVHLPALELMLGSRPVTPARALSARSRQLHLRLEDRTLRWRDGHISIQWHYETAGTIGRTSASVDMIPTATFTSPRPLSLKTWLNGWLAPTNALLTVALGTRSVPRSASLWPKKHLDSMERHGTRLSLFGVGIGAFEHSIDRPIVLATASDFAGSSDALPRALTAIRALSRDHEVFLDLLLGSTQFIERPLRNRFLDVASAIEAYHSKANATQEADLAARFATKRAAAVKHLDKVPPTARRFIKGALPKRPPLSLEQRLTETLGRVGSTSVWSATPAQVAGLRNDIAHGNAHVDARLLRTGYDQVHDLARRVVLAELGLPSGVA